MMLADIDALPAFCRRSRLLSWNSAGLVGFREADFGPRDGTALRPWVEAQLAGAGIADAAAAISILCLPRILGYVFNPITLLFCRGADGQLRAVLVQVSNTWGARHTYLLPVGTSRPIRARADKRLAVSPFTPMDADYEFTLSEPGERFALSIVLRQDRATLLHTSFSGRATPLTDSGLLRCLLEIPLVTLKTFAAIHWQAVRLLLRGARFAPPSPPPRNELSVGP